MNLKEIIDGYDKIRDAVSEAIIAKGSEEFFEEGHWFRFAIMNSDITLNFEEDAIGFHGSAWTNQTMSQEWFSGSIPLDKLGLEL